MHACYYEYRSICTIVQLFVGLFVVGLFVCFFFFVVGFLFPVETVCARIAECAVGSDSTATSSNKAVNPAASTTKEINPAASTTDPANMAIASTTAKSITPKPPTKITAKPNNAESHKNSQAKKGVRRNSNANKAPYVPSDPFPHLGTGEKITLVTNQNITINSRLKEIRQLIETHMGVGTRVNCVHAQIIVLLGLTWVFACMYFFWMQTCTRAPCKHVVVSVYMPICVRLFKLFLWKWIMQLFTNVSVTPDWSSFCQQRQQKDSNEDILRSRSRWIPRAFQSDRCECAKHSLSDDSVNVWVARCSRERGSRLVCETVTCMCVWQRNREQLVSELLQHCEELTRENASLRQQLQKLTTNRSSWFSSIVWLVIYDELSVPNLVSWLYLR